MAITTESTEELPEIEGALEEIPIATVESLVPVEDLALEAIHEERTLPSIRLSDLAAGVEPSEGLPELSADADLSEATARSPDGAVPELAPEPSTDTSAFDLSGGSLGMADLEVETTTNQALDALPPEPEAAPLAPEPPSAAVHAELADLELEPEAEASTLDLDATQEPQPGAPVELDAAPEDKDSALLEFEGSPVLPAPTPTIAAPAPPEVASDAAAKESFSAKELSDEIFSDMDFDLPPAPAATGKPTESLSKAFSNIKPNESLSKAFTPVAARTPSPSNPSVPAPAIAVPLAAGGKPIAPNGAFKPVTPTFLRPSGPVPTAPPVATVQPPPVAPALALPTAPLQKPSSGPAVSLRAALTSDVPPAQLPPELNALALQLCRLLIKKGVIEIDELV